MTTQDKEQFNQWCILELMGHRRLAGKVTETTLCGGGFLRIDIPMKNGTNSTEYYAPAAVYCITPTTEEIARKLALQYQPEPISPWEFHQLFPALTPGERGEPAAPRSGEDARGLLEE
jgi:hypothetical protein